MNTPILPLQPPDPQQAVMTGQEYLERAQEQMRRAQTRFDRMVAQLWIDNADRRLVRWQAQLDRRMPR